MNPARQRRPEQPRSYLSQGRRSSSAARPPRPFRSSTWPHHPRIRPSRGYAPPLRHRGCAHRRAPRRRVDLIAAIFSRSAGCVFTRRSCTSDVTMHASGGACRWLALRARRGGREWAREDGEGDQGERGEEDEGEATVPARHAGGWRRRGPGARSAPSPRGALAAAAAHPRGVVFRSTSAIASLRRAMVSGSTASGSRYGPSRSRTSLTRPRKTLASATKNCGSLL